MQHINAKPPTSHERKVYALESPEMCLPVLAVGTPVIGF